MKLKVTGLAKEFNRRAIFGDISFSLEVGSSLAITGKNGAGKSTLIKIIAGLLTPTRGTVEYSMNGTPVSLDAVRDQIGMVSPYLTLYNEFTAVENLTLLSRIRSNSLSIGERGNELLREFSLHEKRNELVRTYSSGMKQRLKFVFALLHSPAVLLIDEPTSNLDAEGVGVVQTIVEQQKRNGILIVATNSSEEAQWCKTTIHLGQ